MKIPGRRQQQFASTLRNIIARTVQEIVPQDLSSPNRLFSIGRVNISPDLRHAKIEVICHTEFMTENIGKLKKHASIIRKKAASFLHTKYVPNIQFVQAPCYEMSFDLKEKSIR